ncbi:MAG: mechanosensitive ion channel [Rhodocyclaceae bacterium]|nr:mechanosensitive ion channel [Rhodocyclaceae bacterium]MDZ4214624.1 mechanosensitive ion channel [Rhodocyclaceae bacterium]
MVRARIQALFASDQKWTLFVLILGAILFIGTLLSLLTRVTFIDDDETTRPRVAVIGQELQDGVALYLEALNRQGGYLGRPVELLVVDESEAAAGKVLADARVIAAVGYSRTDTLAAAAPEFAAKNIPLVTLQALEQPVPGAVSMGIERHEQGRFAANYARNIVQQRLMYVVRQDDAAYDPLVEPFIDLYRRFETPVRKTWTLSSTPSVAELDEIAKTIGEFGIGGVYLAASPKLAARVVQKIRTSGSAIDFFGPAQLAGGEFKRELARLTGEDLAAQLHGIVAATPVLFDTANDAAQRFQTRYQQHHGESPDWHATLAHDAAQLAIALKLGATETQGLSGRLVPRDGLVRLPIQMGIYNGDSLISAPVQMSPIARGANFNYIEALRQGRVLFVNDRFMFKTNVVYTGITVHEIGDLDLANETAVVDLSIWFRYRGKVAPQEILIDNVADPVVLDKPEESSETDGVQYRRYRIKQKLQMNFNAAGRAFGQHVAGISFRHRQANYNNILYVVDVLGMPTGNELIKDLRQRRVVKGATGWEIDNGWIAQNLVRERGDGEPQYVGMTGEQPLFSTITLGVLIKPASASARDFFSPEHFIYIAIFGLLGSLFAVVMDTRRWGRYWVFQSWLLRVIFWPIFLLAAGNLVLDYAFVNLTPVTTRKLFLIYESLWWIVGAWLTDKAVRRFIWDTLEERSGRKIPNVMKFFVSVMLIALAFAGITAFVFGQTLTSLLATSGVLAMVIGFAIQSNIANVFSGIILNIERPFKVGDYIRINNIIGCVTDITWRTTRIEANAGQSVILANSKVSESLMENLSEVPHGIMAETDFYAAPDASPEIVLPIITEAVAQAKSIICKEEPGFEPMVRYRGIVNLNGQWVAHFSVGYRVAILPKKSKAREELWTFVRQQFIEQGLALAPTEGRPWPTPLAIAAT